MTAFKLQLNIRIRSKLMAIGKIYRKPITEEYAAIQNDLTAMVGFKQFIKR